MNIEQAREQMPLLLRAAEVCAEVPRAGTLTESWGPESLLNKTEKLFHKHPA
jgi:hypothetical protein